MRGSLTNTFVMRNVCHQTHTRSNLGENAGMRGVDGTTAFVSVNVLAALGCFAAAIAHPALSGYEFLCYLSIVLLTSTLKVTLPGIDGTLSVSFIFLFLGMLDMTYAETLAIVAAVVSSPSRASNT